MDEEQVSTVETVPYRFYAMGCCGLELAWINPKPPAYCPSCGVDVRVALNSWLITRDNEANLEIRPED